MDRCRTIRPGARGPLPSRGTFNSRPSGGPSPAKRFACEMAFDPRFQGRRWKDVEAELRAEYPGWLKRHEPDGGGGALWEQVRDAVHEAWDAALDVERAELDPWRGQWDERALEYRPIWENRFGASGRRWEDHEAGYRFADAMALDPEGENMWERLRETIKHAWDHLKH